MIGFRKWRKKIIRLKFKKSIFFVNSSPEAIVHFVQKALLTCKKKTGNFTRRSPEFCGNVLKLDLSE